MEKMDRAFLQNLNCDNCTQTNVWLDSCEAAKYLSISKATLLNEVSLGKIPYYKFGRRNRYLKSELDQLLMLTRGPYYDNSNG